MSQHAARTYRNGLAEAFARTAGAAQCAIAMAALAAWETRRETAAVAAFYAIAMAAIIADALL